STSTTSSRVRAALAATRAATAPRLAMTVAPPRAAPPAASRALPPLPAPAREATAPAARNPRPSHSRRRAVGGPAHHRDPAATSATPASRRAARPGLRASSTRSDPCRKAAAAMPAKPRASGPRTAGRVVNSSPRRRTTASPAAAARKVTNSAAKWNSAAEADMALVSAHSRQILPLGCRLRRGTEGAHVAAQLPQRGDGLVEVLHLDDLQTLPRSLDGVVVLARGNQEHLGP